ncbi:MAG: heparinase II/III family protein [Armatimonadia bacterium]
MHCHTWPLVTAICCLLALFTTVVLEAAPCTLYKPRNLEIARANVAKYQWARDLLASWEKSASFALSKDREFFRGMVSDLTPWSTYGQVCPACVGEKCSMGESGVWRWSVSDPEKLRCRYCGAEFPNPKYPETGVLECPQSGQTFTYYINDAQRAHPEEDLGKHAYLWAGRPVQVSFTGLLRTYKLSWVLGQVPRLAQVYALTGDARYAQRVAWILERVAEVFPKYLYHSYGGCFADCDPAEAAREMGLHPAAGEFAAGVIRHPAAIMRDRNKDGFGDLDAGFWGAGRLSTGAGGEGSTLLNAVVAYDLTKDATDPEGRPVYSEEMKQRICDNLLLAGCADMENYKDINNKCGPGRALSGAVGILFGQPERVRRALEGFESLLGECFHFDGFCKESPSYSSMHLGLMEEIPDLLAGYSDPAGYIAADGKRFDNFDPFTHIPRYRLALESMVRMLRPDLKFPVIGDTHSGSATSPHYVEILAAVYGAQYAGLLQTLQGKPLDQMGSEYALWHRDPDLKAPEGAPDLGLRTEYYPGWQVGVMRAGNDASQTSFYFNGYCAHGHRHSDTLGIVYHAFNQELASDRGYIWDDPRNSWTRSTLAHNLVTVDGENQRGAGRHSTLELFAATPGLEIMQASADAYDQCSQYRRTCALIRVPDGGNYVVDFFRVDGGKQHQYGLNCNGSFVGLTGAEVQPREGKRSWLTNLRAADNPPESWQATWQDGAAKLRLFMAGPTDRLWVTDAPGWRSNKGDQLHAPPITEVLAERSAKDKLSSVFAAVLCPYKTETPPVTAVRRIAAEPAAEGAVCLAVEVGDRTDYVISALDDEPHTYGPVRMAGRFGIVSVDRTGKPLRAYLLSGTDLSCGEMRLHLDAPRTVRKIVKVEGSTLELDAALPAEVAKSGVYLLTGDTGFEIAALEGNRLTVRDYPFEGGEEIVVPGAVWTGME